MSERWLPAVLVSLVAMPALAQNAPETHRDECFVCHGADARGNPAIGAPALAALEPEYLRRQLENYRSGLRGADARDEFGVEMLPIALALDEHDVIEVSQSFIALPVVSHEATITGSLERGAAVYAGCAACHGVEGEGRPELGAPRLSGQRDWYLQRQIVAFRDGLRGAAAADGFGMQMSAAAEVLDDAAIGDVVTYINALSRKLTQDSP